ncbi:MAG: DUF3667 domain-containing protein [Saprospiraceae bacterium]|nr:DUF3667 domain-containing protein [Saprospiraceae bacterium]
MSKQNRSDNHLEFCLNCGRVLEPYDKFCGVCGQMTHNGKLPLLKMFKEFLSDQLNIDGKALITLKSLLVPGQLTIDYFEGKRKSQINPIRLFLVTAIVALASLQLYDLKLGNIDQLRRIWGSQNSMESLNAIDSLQKILIDRQVDDTDSIIKDLRNKLAIESDSIDIKSTEGVTILSDFFEKELTGTAKVSRKDFESLSPSEIVKKLEIGGLASIYFRQKIKLLKNPSSLADYVIQNLAWIYLFYIPIIAIILKILYIRRKRYYIEHLVFSLHMHTAFIIFMITAALLVRLIGDSAWSLILLFFAFYLFIGIKRFYSQGFFKTLVKFCILQFSYPIIFTAFVVVAGLLSLLFF